MEFPALVFDAPGEVEVRGVEVPDPGVGEVLIRSEYSMVSAGVERAVWQGDSFPVVPGYQRVGIVEELGEGVSRLQPGMRVVAQTSRFEGVTAMWGSHCQYALSPAEECLLVPSSVPPLAASGLVLAQVGYTAGSVADVAEGSLAVVLGDGLLGQWCAQRLRGRGARVVVAGRHELRLDRAEAHARARGVNVAREDLGAVVRSVRPEGADLVVDTLATAESLAQAEAILREDGQLIRREPGRRTTGNAFSATEATLDRLKATLELVLERKMEVEDLVTHELAWPEAAEAYRRLLRDREEEFLGVVIDWMAV